MSTRASILADLKTSLEKILIRNGYAEDIKLVLRGLRSREDFSGNLPGLAIWSDEGPREESEFGESVRALMVHIWGFCDVNPPNNDYSNLDNLLADVEKCLMTPADNARYDRTVIGNTIYYEGGSEDPFGAFDMEVTISYDYVWTEP